jgi:hypothetical protein
MGEKELLIKDLCARFPYHTMVEYRGGTVDYTEYSRSVRMEDCKPYLRPLSDMTEKEYSRISRILSDWFDSELFILTEEPFIEYALSQVKYSISPMLFDWMNEHHFDYRGLIAKGLALPAPKGMYVFE